MFEQAINQESISQNSPFSILREQPWARRIANLLKRKNREETVVENRDTVHTTKKRETETQIKSAEELLPKLALEAQISLLNSVDIAELRNNEAFNPFQLLFNHVKNKLKEMGLGDISMDLATSAVDGVRVSDLFPFFYYYQRADDNAIRSMIAASKDRLLNDYTQLSLENMVDTLVKELPMYNKEETFDPQEIVTIVENRFDQLANDYSVQLLATGMDQTIIDDHIQHELKPKVVAAFGKIFISQFLKRR